jgi:hypothetical protein
MATTYKILGQVATATLGAVTEGTLYTAGSQAIISSLVVCNQAASPASYRIAVRPAGDNATAAKHYIIYGATVASSDTTVLTLGLTLGTGDKILVYGSSATLSFNVYGSELG